MFLSISVASLVFNSGSCTFPKVFESSTNLVLSGAKSAFFSACLRSFSTFSSASFLSWISFSSFSFASRSAFNFSSFCFCCSAKIASCFSFSALALSSDSSRSNLAFSSISRCFFSESSRLCSFYLLFKLLLLTSKDYYFHILIYIIRKAFFIHKELTFIILVHSILYSLQFNFT